MRIESSAPTRIRIRSIDTGRETAAKVCGAGGARLLDYQIETEGLRVG